MPDTAPPSARAVFGNRDYVLFLAARFISFLAVQMQGLAVGWQIYQVTHRTLDLGLVGLAQFFPAIGFSLITGHVADRFERRRIVLVCYGLFGILSLGLVELARRPDLGTAPIYAVLFLLGTTRAFANPAGQALLPNLVPPEHFRSAIAWSSTVWQLATIVGPGLGGFLIKPLGVYGVYRICSVIFFASMLIFFFVSKRPPPEGAKKKGFSLETLAAGVTYVWQNKMVLGAISLDLFAVLLGGAVALMPAFAQDILFVGPNGMGALRSAPSLGAAVVAVVLAYYPLKRRAGILMFSCVFLFGVATIVFGYSRNFYLSLAALVVVGASDMVSVVVRQTLIQLNTPEAVRGRVSAVNMVFIGASNELGEFESGITAQWLGLVRAVVVGGFGTCLVVLAWAGMFPDLRKAEGLEAPRGA